jgi:DNA-binding NarL/FixJ family response regulator
VKRRVDALNGFYCYSTVMNFPLLNSSVLVIENHPLMREALCAAITEEPDLKVAGQVATGTEGMVLAASTQPDIILWALGSPRSLEMETFIALRKSLPDCVILVLTSGENEGQEQAAQYIGAQAVLSKTAPRSELMQTLRQLRTARLEAQKLDFENQLNQHLTKLETPHSSA